jgi:hypothetical protein
MGLQLKSKAKNFIKKLDLKNPEVRKKATRHVGNVALACLSVVFLAPAGGAIDSNTTVAVNNEAAKTALSEALKVTRSKPALSLAAMITCVACAPVAGAAASPALCVACGILIAKVIG